MTMTSSIQVSEEMIEAGMQASDNALTMRHDVLSNVVTAIYLAMKAAEPLPQGDGGWQAWKPSDIVEARLCNGMIVYGELCEFNLGRRDVPTTIVALRFPAIGSQSIEGERAGE